MAIVVWGSKASKFWCNPLLSGLKLVSAVTVFTVWPPEWRSLRENCFIPRTRNWEAANNVSPRWTPIFLFDISRSSATNFYIRFEIDFFFKNLETFSQKEMMLFFFIFLKLKKYTFLLNHLNYNLKISMKQKTLIKIFTFFYISQYKKFIWIHLQNKILKNCFTAIFFR